MLKGFKDFLARGNIIDLSVAVVIGTAFTALVTKFTEGVVTPLVTRVSGGTDTDLGVLRIGIGGGEAIDLNLVVSALINFVIVAAVVYFVIVLPYKKLRERGEVEQAQDTELTLLMQIRDLLAATDGSDGRHGVAGTAPGSGPDPDTAETTSADKS